MTKIPKKLMYVPKLGFISSAKVIFTSCLLTALAIFAMELALPAAIPQAHATQEQLQVRQENPVDPLVAKQQKIAAYIKDVSYPAISNNTANQLADSIIQVYWKYNIPIEIQLALATHESKFDQYALGRDGELGFFQVLPKAHIARILHMMQTDEISTKNLYDPYTNSSVAANILNACLQEKHHIMKKALACYNGSDKSVQYASDVLAVAKKIKPLI